MGSKRKRKWGLLNAVEFDALMWSLETVAGKQLDADAYVEVGTFKANTSAWIYERLAAINPSTKFVGVDVTKEARHAFVHRVKEVDGGPERRFLKCPSIVAVDRIEGQYAWVFIDACHCYVCAAADIAAWAPRIARGGHMAFHDTNMVRLVNKKQHVQAHSFGVKPAVDDSEILRRDFDIVRRVDESYGMEVYERK